MRIVGEFLFFGSQRSKKREPPHTVSRDSVLVDFTRAARQLAEIPGVGIDPAKVQTNIVIYSVKNAGFSSSDFLAALSKRKVLAVPVDADRVRMVTNLDVNRAGVETAAAAVREVLKK